MRKQLVASIMSTAAVLLLPRSRLKLLWPSFSFGCRVSPSELKGRRAPPCELYGSELLRLSCSPALHELLRLPCSFARPPKQQTPPPPCSSSSAAICSCAAAPISALSSNNKFHRTAATTSSSAATASSSSLCIYTIQKNVFQNLSF
nr:uncharacterized protein LOC127330197 [Lolium perenne]